MPGGSGGTDPGAPANPETPVVSKYTPITRPPRVHSPLDVQSTSGGMPTQERGQVDPKYSPITPAPTNRTPPGIKKTPSNVSKFVPMNDPQNSQFNTASTTAVPVNKYTPIFATPSSNSQLSADRTAPDAPRPVLEYGHNVSAKNSHASNSVALADPHHRPQSEASSAPETKGSSFRYGKAQTPPAGSDSAKFSSAPPHAHALDTKFLPHSNTSHSTQSAPRLVTQNSASAPATPATRYSSVSPQYEAIQPSSATSFQEENGGGSSSLSQPPPNYMSAVALSEALNAVRPNDADSVVRPLLDTVSRQLSLGHLNATDFQLVHRMLANFREQRTLTLKVSHANASPAAQVPVASAPPSPGVTTAPPPGIVRKRKTPEAEAEVDLTTGERVGSSGSAAGGGPPVESGEWSLPDYERIDGPKEETKTGELLL